MFESVMAIFAVAQSNTKVVLRKEAQRATCYEWTVLLYPLPQISKQTLWG